MAKKSLGAKTSKGGRKWAARRPDADGIAEAEVIGTGPVPAELAGHQLLVELVRAGEVTAREPLDAVRARHTLQQLSIVSAGKVSVRREGRSQDVPRDEVVVDDLVELAPGDQIAVDGTVVDAEHLQIDESLLTGEADAVRKENGDELRSGSFVVAGSGAMRVTAVGDDAYAARLAAEAGKFTLVESQLRNGIDRILQVVTYLLIPAGLLTIVNQALQAKEDWRSAVLGMVAALTPMVPEGLVLLTSVAFAVGIIRLGRRDCLVNELPAIEGLARVDVVCADKTGTLTEAGMRFDRIEVVSGDDADEARVPAALAALAAADPHPNTSMHAIEEAHPDDPGWEATASAPVSSETKWSGVSFGEHGHWVLGGPDVLADPESEVGRRAGEISAAGDRVMLVATSDRSVEASDAPGQLTPRAWSCSPRRCAPTPATPSPTSPPRTSTPRSSPATTRAGSAPWPPPSVSATRGTPATRATCPPTGRRSPTRWSARPSSVGCTPARSVPSCRPCSRAATPSR